MRSRPNYANSPILFNRGNPESPKEMTTGNFEGKNPSSQILNQLKLSEDEELKRNSGEEKKIK